MKDEAINILDQISNLITSYQYYEEAEEQAGESIQEDVHEYYRILNFAYDLLTRTALISSIKVKTPEEMKEPGFEEEYIQSYGIAADEFADFSFALATQKGEISLRRLLRTMINRAGFGDKPITMKDVCMQTHQGYPNMSRYLSGKQSLSSDNYEKALNFVLKK